MILTARRSGRSGGAGLFWSWLAAIAALVAAPAARAQVDTVPAHYVTVERENIPLQCRIGSASYPVKMVTTGQVLKVDGQSASMYRVEYPAGMSAFVKVEEAALAAGGKTLTLTKPSRLMAPNAEGGVSWWYLLEKELDAGTKLDVQKTVKGPDGKDSGYLVPAPAGSKAYIRRDYTRVATQAEIDKLLGKVAEAPVVPAVTPPDAPKPEEPKPAEPAKPTETTKPSETPKPTETPKPADGAPAATPGEVKAPEVAPVDGNPGVTTIAVKPPEGTTPPAVPANPPTEPAKPVLETPAAVTPKPVVTARSPVDAATLEKLYAGAMKTMDNTELDAVMAEFQRTIDSLPKDNSSARVKGQLEARLRALKLRSDLQAQLRQSAVQGDALRQQSDAMKAELRRLESLRQYTVVGRLVASSVYDGRNLPLMYRVLSPEPVSTRTLAYVAPEANADLADKIGKLVGVVGESKFDESLRVNIIAPTRIEILGALNEAANQATPPVPAPAPAPTRVPATPDENK